VTRAGERPINYNLLQDLSNKAHPLLNICDDWQAQVRQTPPSWIGEVFQEARTAHHLLDMVGIPYGTGYAQDLDSRTYLAITALIDARGRLDRIAGWHSRETADGGMVGDFCNDCDQRWPCQTRRMADGTHEDLADTVDGAP